MPSCTHSIAKLCGSKVASIEAEVLHRLSIRESTFNVHLAYADAPANSAQCMSDPNPASDPDDDWNELKGGLDRQETAAVSLTVLLFFISERRCGGVFGIGGTGAQEAKYGLALMAAKSRQAEFESFLHLGQSLFFVALPA